ncbi:MAG: hypothetical protein ACRD1B_07225, partial [Thermoanaerobaculia bacterium]
MNEAPGNRPGRLIRVAAATVLGVSLLGPSAAAQTGGEGETSRPAPDVQSSDMNELARRSTDPTAAPMNFAFLNAVTASYYDKADGTPVGQTGYDLKLQPVLPFKAWGTDNI